jgi:hypothetical protein
VPRMTTILSSMDGCVNLNLSITLKLSRSYD